MITHVTLSSNSKVGLFDVVRTIEFVSRPDASTELTCFYTVQELLEILDSRSPGPNFDITQLITHGFAHPPSDNVPRNVWPISM